MKKVKRFQVGEKKEYTYLKVEILSFFGGAYWGKSAGEKSDKEMQKEKTVNSIKLKIEGVANRRDINDFIKIT